MAEASEERSNSVIETSLTELAFIFFFILLTVSAWKISSAAEELNTSEQEQKALEQQISQLSESLATASEFLTQSDQFDPEELFQELKAGRKASAQLEKALQEKSEAEDQLRKLTESLPSELSREEVAKQLKEYRDLAKVIEEYGDGQGESPVKVMTELVQDFKDAKGQNINLRNKLDEVGNGLDHPPCWADPETGSIEYVFDVIINEEFIEFKAGWPDSRAAQALNNPNIIKVPGKFSKNSELWSRTAGLFEESVSKGCRHFVRVYDHANSKKAFKNYLLGIENHFYKFLSARNYQ